jgi:hypothetical protein
VSEPLNKQPSKKSGPKPTKLQLEKVKYFEFELLDVSIDSYKNKQYLKSAMTSWSFIEEFFLPSSIESIAKSQKIKFQRGFIERQNVSQLIKYYYFISYDEEIFDLLTEARKLRNNLVHGVYESGSVKEIEERSQKSAKYNLHTVMEPLLNRLKGAVIAPSLMLYANGWNDMRAETIERLEAL